MIYSVKIFPSSAALVGVAISPHSKEDSPMNEQLQAQFELFTQNSKAIQDKFFWEWDTMKKTCCLLYTLQNKAIDYDAIKQNLKLIQKTAGGLSYLNGRLSIVIACQLALSDNPERQLANTMLVYDKMKKLKFYSSDYLVYAAYSIAEQAKEEEYDDILKRARSFYEGVKKDHRFLTCEDDYIYVTTFALTDEPVEDGVAKAEEIFTLLKPHFSTSNETQGLALTFATQKNSLQLAERLLEMKEAFTAAGFKMNKEESASVLEILTLVPWNIDELVASVIEGYQHFTEKKVFGGWTAEKDEVLLFAASLVAYHYSSINSASDSSLLTKVIARVISKVVMLLIVVVVVSN